jgi:hypothetical protein
MSSQPSRRHATQLLPRRHPVQERRLLPAQMLARLDRRAARLRAAKIKVTAAVRPFAAVQASKDRDIPQLPLPGGHGRARLYTALQGAEMRRGLTAT